MFLPLNRVWKVLCSAGGHVSVDQGQRSQEETSVRDEGGGGGFKPWRIFIEKQAVYHKDVNVTLFWNAVGSGGGCI